MKLLLNIFAGLAALLIAGTADAQLFCPGSANAIGQASAPITSLPYTIGQNDICLLKTFNSATPGTVRIPPVSPGSTFPLYLSNIGAGTVTLQPLSNDSGKTPLLNGHSTATITTGQGGSLALGGDGNWYLNTTAPIAFNGGTVTNAITAPSFGVGNNLNLLTTPTPSLPTVSTSGTAGSTSYTYGIVALNASGTSTGLSFTATITTGNATLNSTNFNTISWSAVTNAAQYQVWRTASGGTPSSTGLIGTVTGTSFNDQGAAGNSATAPGVNLTGVVTQNGTPILVASYANRLSPNPDPENLLIGPGAGMGLSPSSAEITSVGYNSLGAIGTGFTGVDSTAVGYRCFQSLQAGSDNTGVGNVCFGDATTLSDVTAIGEDVGRHSTSASAVIAIGAKAFFNSACTTCIGIGNSVFSGLASSASNLVVIAHNALDSAVLSNPNNAVLIGTNIFNSNTVVTPTTSVVIGDNIGNSAVSPTGLVIVGHSAAGSITTDTNIVSVGLFNLRHLAGSSGVTALGANVGSTTAVNPQNVVLIGTNASTDVATASEQNTIHIGAGAADIIKATGTGTPATSATTIAGTLAISGTASSAAALNYACFNSSTGAITYDSAGTCLASREDFKDIFERITPDEANDIVMKLHPFWGKYKDSQTGIADHRVHAMLGAHQVEKVDRRLASYDGGGKVRAFRDLTPVLVTALQKQQAEIDAVASHQDKNADDPLTPLKSKIKSQQVQLYFLYFWCFVLSGSAIRSRRK